MSMLDEETIRRYITEAKSKETLFKEELIEILRQREEDSVRINEVKTMIINRNEEIKKQLDSIAERQLMSCAQHQTNNSNKLDQWKRFYERKQQNLKSKIQQLESMLNSGELQNVTDSVLNFRESDEHPPISPSLMTSASFHTGRVTMATLEEAHGDLFVTEYRNHTDGYTLITKNCSTQTSDVTSYKVKDKVKVAGFRHPSEISCMALTSDNEAWIACTKKPYTSLLKVTQEGNVSQKLPIKTDFKDICLSPTTNNLWICSPKKKAVMDLEGLYFNTKVETAESPFRLCITREETIVVCYQNKVEEFEYRIKGKSLRINPSGNNIRPKGSVKNPVRIKQCELTGNFAVCDMDDVTQGGKGVPSVLVMDRRFVEKFRYYGKNIDTKRYPAVCQQTRIEFEPVDVCFDDQGHLLIADKVTKSILLVSKDGVYIGCLHSGSVQPKAISMKDGYVWVGYMDKSVEILTYELSSGPALPEFEVNRSWYDTVLGFFGVLREYYL